MKAKEIIPISAPSGFNTARVKIYISGNVVSVSGELLAFDLKAGVETLVLSGLPKPAFNAVFPVTVYNATCTGCGYVNTSGELYLRFPADVKNNNLQVSATYIVCEQ